MKMNTLKLRSEKKTAIIKIGKDKAEKKVLVAHCYITNLLPI